MKKEFIFFWRIL